MASSNVPRASLAQSDSRYILPHGTQEQTRLSKQYTLIKRVFDRTSSLPPSIDPYAINRVIDVAAGTCIWALDFASEEAVVSRSRQGPLAGACSSTSSLPPIEIFACDITDAKFPDSKVLADANISTLIQDVTRPFPDAMHGTFDLVHMSFVVYALTAEGWAKALRNIYQLLRPGGTVVLWESDSVMYSSSRMPPEPDERHDFEASMSGSTWLSKLNCVHLGNSLKSGFIPDLSYQLPSLLDSAHFTNISSVRSLSPFGKLCAQLRGLEGGSLADLEEWTTENLVLVMNAVTGALMNTGTLSSLLGEVQIDTEEGRKALVGEWERGSREEGLCIVVSEWIARKVRNEKT